MSWSDVREGRGLARIPSGTARDLGCSVPGPHSGLESLYTAEPLPAGPSQREYDRQLSRVRQTALCKRHALWLYGD